MNEIFFHLFKTDFAIAPSFLKHYQNFGLDYYYPFPDHELSLFLL